MLLRYWGIEVAINIINKKTWGIDFVTWVRLSSFFARGAGEGVILINTIAKVDLTCHSKSIFNKFSNFLYCLENEHWLLPFTSSLFQIHFSTDFLSHLNIISLFIIYSFFYHHFFFLYSFPTIIFFNEKYYIHNIFRNIFTRITSKSYVESCY